MTNRTVTVLRQMRAEIGWIEADTEGLDRSGVERDRRAHQLVERNLEILSEGSRRIPRDLKATEPDIDWSALASLGNVLRHAYQRIDPGHLWTLLTDELGPLSAALRRLEQRSQAPSDDP